VNKKRKVQEGNLAAVSFQKGLARIREVGEGAKRNTKEERQKKRMGNRKQEKKRASKFQGRGRNSNGGKGQPKWMGFSHEKEKERRLI